MAKVKNKSDNCRCSFTYNYDIATYWAKIYV